MEHFQLNNVQKDALLGVPLHMNIHAPEALTNPTQSPKVCRTEL